jgi:hypothetical protein
VSDFAVRYSDVTREQAGQWRDEALVDAEAARLRGDDPAEFERRAALWASEAEKAQAS